MLNESPLILPTDEPATKYNKKIAQPDTLPISKDIAEKVLPSLDLNNKNETINNVMQLLNSLEGCRTYYDDLEGDEDPKDEELLEAYDAYVAEIESILPSGYKLERIFHPLYSRLWRGTDPIVSFSVLNDPNNKMVIDAEYPTIAHKWETSLAYGTGKTNKKLPFVLALGMKRPENLKTIRKEKFNVYDDIIESVDGSFNLDDVTEIAIRFNGKEPGKVFPPTFYKLTQKKAA